MKVLSYAGTHSLVLLRDEGILEEVEFWFLSTGNENNNICQEMRRISVLLS